jgi:hypothetical protein
MPTIDPSDSLMTTARKAVNAKGSVVVPVGLITAVLAFGTTGMKVYDFVRDREKELVQEAMVAQQEKAVLEQRLSKMERRLEWLEFYNCVVGKHPPQSIDWKRAECRRPE